MLNAIRRDHRISLHKVRIAIDFIKEELKSDHPLAYYKLETDGLDLFVEEYGQLINVSQAGQLVLRELLQAHLRRIDRDSAGYARRLYPFTRKRPSQQLIEEPKAIVIDPRISFGRPVLAGTGIPTAICQGSEMADIFVGCLDKTGFSRYRMATRATDGSK